MNNEDDYVIIRDYVISLIRDFLDLKVLYLGLSIWATCSVNDKTHMTSY